jgi:16S rRNA (guanine527-N7)-methyltransferase
MTDRLPSYPDLWQSTLSWQPTAEQQQKFQAFYEQILIGNSQINLTRITEPSEFWEKHLWDSLSGLSAIDAVRKQQSCRSIDIGTGAGFPGVPIAIAHPLWRVTLLDSTRKKLVFLQPVLEKLSLKNAQILVGRAEAIAREKTHRATYDLATVRAVGAASICAGYALPFLKVGGTAILYRGQWSPAEATDLRSAVDLFGGEITIVQAFQTPLTQSTRHCIHIRKSQEVD